MVYNTGSGGGGNCTRRSDSSSRVDRCPCKIDGGRCVGNRSKPRDTNAGPRRDRHPVAVPAIANCARHNGACPVPELTSSCVGSPKNLRTSVRHTDACHSQGAQGTDREHSQAGSCQTANDGSDKSGMGVPRSIETRNKTHACMALRWNETKKNTVLSHQDGKRPRKGPLFGGARLTIEPGSDFPIGVIPPSAGRKATGNGPNPSSSPGIKQGSAMLAPITRSETSARRGKKGHY